MTHRGAAGARESHDSSPPPLRRSPSSPLPSLSPQPRPRHGPASPACAPPGERMLAMVRSDAAVLAGTAGGQACGRVCGSASSAEQTCAEGSPGPQMTDVAPGSLASASTEVVQQAEVGANRPWLSYLRFKVGLGPCLRATTPPTETTSASPPASPRQQGGAGQPVRQDTCESPYVASSPAPAASLAHPPVSGTASAQIAVVPAQPGGGGDSVNGGVARKMRTEEGSAATVPVAYEVVNRASEEAQRASRDTAARSHAPPAAERMSVARRRRAREFSRDMRPRGRDMTFYAAMAEEGEGDEAGPPRKRVSRDMSRDASCRVSAASSALGDESDEEGAAQRNAVMRRRSTGLEAAFARAYSRDGGRRRGVIDAAPAADISMSDFYKPQARRLRSAERSMGPAGCDSASPMPSRRSATTRSAEVSGAEASGEDEAQPSGSGYLGTLPEAHSGQLGEFLPDELRVRSLFYNG